jgi:2-polyprenyl-6-hydroxyphenyl methylase / 3-demethylubiquinone-9 3-methyltransferase
MNPDSNVDAGELARFEERAAHWWDPHGEFKPLHDINPLRLDYIDARANLAGKAALDVGCGGGLLAEGMAKRGARVTGIDMVEGALTVARLHLLESGLEVDYRKATAEQLAAENSEQFDVVTCMELLEHVPDPGSIMAACGTLVRPGGQLFFSTINRQPKAYLFAVVGAEYLLHMLPKGTHSYSRFIRPSELAAWMRRGGLEMKEIDGMAYNPLTREYFLTADLSVNYLGWAARPDDTGS